MTIAVSVNGARVVVPGTYTQFTVDDSLANIAPGARNVLLIGEAAKGVPGSLLDLGGLFFNDYASLKAYFGSGPLVDAGRMIFSQQSSPAFAGSVGRVYCFKTNASARGSKNLVAGSSVYGQLLAAEYGIEGNLIASQLKTATTEVKPSVSAYWVMTNSSSALKLRVSGGAELSAAIAAQALPSEIVTTINGLSGGVIAAGGALKTIISSAQVTAADRLDLAVASSEITLSVKTTLSAASTFQGADVASLAAGDLLYIPAASVVAGSGSENVGAYVVTSASSSQIKAKKIGAIAPVAVAAGALTALSGSQSAVATAGFVAYAALTISVSASTAVGTGASLELYATAGALSAARSFWAPAQQLNPISAVSALTASIALAVVSSVGTFSITSGSFQNLPAAGDVLWVLGGSPLAGAANENLGAWVVQSAGSTRIVATKVISGGASVASVLAAEDAFKVQPGIASTSLASKLNISAQERQMNLIASRQSDGASFPVDKVGGRVVLELSYAGTTATADISANGILKTTVAGGSGANLSANLGQFVTMGDLVAFLNSKTGYAAKVSNAQFNALSPRAVLDRVSGVGICSGAVAAYNGRIKADYYDFKSFLDANFGLVAFKESPTLVLKAGLPDAESVLSFLSGGLVGSTSDASVAAGFDAALKVAVEQVVPLFSRDASKDIEDGLTDEGSTYTIDAVHVNAKSHVGTASSTQYQKERFAMLSYHGSFANAKLKAAAMSNERVQLAFQMVRTTGSDGSIKWFLPYMEAVALVAGRVQSALGTSLLRKSFAFADVKHLGDVSVYSDLLAVDFDPDTKELDQAIEAGLLALRPVNGFGVRLESPDLSTRSRSNDPKAWFYERVNVEVVADVVNATLRGTLDNFIGNRTSDTTPSVVRNAVESVLNSFLSSGALKKYSIDSVKAVGNTYEVNVAILPTESVEFIILNVTARRDA